MASKIEAANTLKATCYSVATIISILELSHMYIVFVVVFTLVGKLVSGNELLVCLSISFISYYVVTALRQLPE